MTEQRYPGAVTKMVAFGDRVQGFLAEPAEGTGGFPAVVLGHERYGLVQHTLDLAANFARDGYVCIAPDLFSRWECDKAKLNRGEVQVPISDDDIKSYMSDGLDFLLKHPKVDPSRIAAMGVCQSGSFPLLLNSIRSEVIANIVIYGGAQIAEYTARSPIRHEPYEHIVSRITAPVIGIWGEDDFVISMPGRYRPKETAKVWAMILDFLERAQNGAFPPDRMVWRFDSDAAVSYDFTKKVRLA
jgi:carboxymethylenebutenolidase